MLLYVHDEWSQSMARRCRPVSNVDWTYRGTASMIWWGRFRVAEQPKNERDAPGLDCEAILDDDPRATDGLYWIDLDGEGGDPAFTAICDMENGGWTQLWGITTTVRTRPLGDWITIRPSIAGRTLTKRNRVRITSCPSVDGHGEALQSSAQREMEPSVYPDSI